MKLKIILLLLVSTVVFSSVYLTTNSSSDVPILLSQKTIHNEQGILLAYEKGFSDKTFSHSVNFDRTVTNGQPTCRVVDTPTQNPNQLPLCENDNPSDNANKLNLRLESIPRGSQVVDGVLTIPILVGNPNSSCQLFLTNDFLNEVPVTDVFPCVTTPDVKLNKVGIDVMTTKIDTLATYQVKQINTDNELSFFINPHQMVFDITFKKPQYFANLNSNNLVLDVIVADDQFISAQSGNWKEVFRNNYAGIGQTYNATLDKYISPQPYPSYTLNATGFWNNPIPYPTDGNNYEWNEETLSWLLF